MKDTADTASPLPSSLAPAVASAVMRTPLYFGPASDSLFGWYHTPQAQSPSQTALVICPPIGYEYMHAHRSLRHLADRLAGSGLPTLRFDYHGSGDSGGLNQDPDRVAAWLDSIRQAVFTVRHLSGCEEVGLIGLRMGASFAAMIAAETEIGPLVLWEPCTQGRRFVRELRALYMTASSQPDTPLQEAADIESAGFVITAQTAADLGVINLRELRPQARRVLVCQRDDTPEDNRLREDWTQLGVNVDLIRFSGYAELMAETHFTVVPDKAIADINAWLCQQARPSAAGHAQPVIPDAPRQHAHMRFRHYLQDDETATQEREIEEHILQFGQGGALFGIVSQPETTLWQRHPTIILLNSGSVHHVGPHRLYVFLARHFAQMGFRTLRLDMAGIGDSVIADPALENHPYTKTSTHDAAAAIVALKQAQPEAEFVLMGLCSGAFASFHAARDIIGERICECALINPLTFYWKEGMTLAIPSEAHYRQWSDYRQSMRKPDKWLKLLRGQVSVREILHTVLERLRILAGLQWKAVKKRLTFKKSRQAGRGDLAEDLYRIVELERHISFVFSEHDPGYDLLMTTAGAMVKKLQNRHQLSIQTISRADHTFSKNAARQVVIARLASLLKERYGQS